MGYNKDYMKARDFLLLGFLIGSVIGFITAQALMSSRPAKVNIWEAREYTPEEEKDIRDFAQAIEPWQQVMHSLIIHGGNECNCPPIEPPNEMRGDANSIERGLDSL